MIHTLERVIERVLELVGGWMFGLAMTLVAAIAVAAFLGLSLYKFDRESCLRAMRRVGETVRRGWAWALVAVLLLIQMYGMDVLHQGLMQRLAQEDKALYISADDQGGGPTTQRAPGVSFLETSTLERRIVVPAGTLDSINALPGWSPEQARYGTAPAVNVEDELVRDTDHRTVVINRKTTVTRFVPAKLASSRVDVRLQFRDRQLGQRRQFYKADFAGRYSFVNPYPDKRQFHFTFPLPDNSGTLSGFHFRVNGQELPPGDISQGLQYEADLSPGQRTTVEVAYSHLGSTSWAYDVAGRREPIADFHLQVHVDNSDVKFQRGSLYPTSLTNGVRNTALSWDLQSQITSQSINLYFPSVDVEQLIGNLYVFGPVGVLFFTILTVVWARLRRTGTQPWIVLLASLVACTGYALTSYLVSYVPMFPALLLGFGVTAVLQTVALGQRLLVPIVVLTLAPFAFLVAGHTGLLLSILAMAALGVTIVETLRTRDVVRLPVPEPAPAG